MKRFLFINFFGLFLQGCGVGDRLPPIKPIIVDPDFICFATGKNDVVSSYIISSTMNDKYKVSSVKERVALRYPETCIKITLPRGYVYSTMYTLNNNFYRYAFFIDNNGHIFSAY
ncbi:putative T6SS immunity periplasmic lipoprotein [Enterobacter sp. CC120223-11]|uniref:putative T6SS immunity periplasmic lipoprotein n=1 Tax=Enterobacter sp. CC120223-11 TaxID=1378073 RepID=UPI000BCB1181|nr:hypothetical protein SAMN02744775_04026 [Enterobacter sp. CC120223-11]